MQTPRRTYIARLEREGLLDQRLREGMDSLFEMGFVDYDVNLVLMKKYGHHGAAAEHIITHGTQGLFQ